jgi:MYXO-CTERM domain-containing protein
MKARILFASSLFGIAGIASASFYQLDDGVSESSLSTSGSNLNVIFLTQYTVQAGGTTLTSIDLVWGDRFSANLANGTPTQVLLMSDPNNDGNPNDSTVIQAINTTAANVGTDTFNNYAITPVSMSVGTSFFVGGFIPNLVSGTAWAAVDTSAVGMAGRNFWQPQGLPGSTSYLPYSIFGTNDGTFMVRANATSVPEPASMTAVAVGALALLRRRRR